MTFVTLYSYQTSFLYSIFNKKNDPNWIYYLKYICLLYQYNLNWLGKRRTDLYGRLTYEAFVDHIRAKVEQAGFILEAYQSNHEGDLIDALQHAYTKGGKGILFNPGAFTHYAYALHDAVEMKTMPVVEVHFSNIETREPWRAQSVISPVVDARFFGEGMMSYEKAFQWLMNLST